MENIIYSPSGNVSIRINDDKMSAWMYIHKSDKIIDEKEILNLIDDSGICHGFEEALEWMAENGYNKDFDKPFPVAICKTSASNETISHRFDPTRSYNPEKEWQFRDVQTWTYVEEGSVLAEVSFNLFNDGASVYNIFGELATNLSGSLMLSDYLGQNVCLDSDKKQIIAAVSGYPYVDENNKIHVADNLVYKGDVKLTKVPLTLSVALTICGTVNKAHLSVLKDITITGNVISAEIYSEGNIAIKGDIIDCQTTGVIAMGDLNCNSIINSLVLCKGKLSFDTSINNSRVIAEKYLSGNPEISRISESQVFSAVGVDVAEVGDTEGKETEIEITISPFNRERIAQLKKTIAKLEENYDLNSERIDQGLKKMRVLETNFAEDLKTYYESADEIPRYVKVREHVYKGTYIRVLKKSYKVKQNQDCIEYTE
jgi:uncharacterized protein (DUF342 family)